MELNGNVTDYHGEFADRADAGRRLAQALTRYQVLRPAVLAVPPGGVPVGFEIARALAAPFDVVEDPAGTWRSGRPPLSFAGRIAIVADDGSAPAGILRAAVRTLAAAGAASTVLAAPVAPPEMWYRVAAEADDAVCLLLPPDFRSVAFYYRDFPPVGDAEATDLLRRAGTP
ncbi:MAG: phosphoribosyltransferase [Rhodocyclaceae bacterium]|nr:phosphoribosyltransferase [Rhodocyclaceae bacterium]